MRWMTSDDIDRIVTYHEVNDKGVLFITDLRMQAHAMMNLIRVHVPESDEKTMAFTKMQETLFWAVAGIARDPQYWPDDE